jgi:anti-sigma factor RsiW
MRDMTRDDLQDLLPELLHGRLSATDAAELERAVAADPALSAELTLLRAVRRVQQPVRVIDVARIVAALPSPPVTQLKAVIDAPMVDAPVIDDLAQRRDAKRPMLSRRFARAAALLIVVGGGTMVSVWERRGTASAPVPPIAATDTPAVAAGTAMQLGLGTSTDELSVEQLRALEADIRSLDGVTSAEPEAATELLPSEGA